MSARTARVMTSSAPAPGAAPGAARQAQGTAATQRANSVPASGGRDKRTGNRGDRNIDHPRALMRRFSRRRGPLLLFRRLIAPAHVRAAPHTIHPPHLDRTVFGLAVLGARD